ncbi:hypothetical protein V2J09_005819 [Rumex salicifolius]
MVKFVTGKRNPKGLDSFAGRLVWVRRKNGSWWPGQIMNMNDSCLDEAKSNGVPIKLLARDDVNVEWYNLEVAKEVKAFRCEDFNSCIKKAEALQANSSKRKLRLSQRESAIILALELEATLMSENCVDNFCEADNMVKRKRTRNHSEHDDRSDGIKKRIRGLDDMDVEFNKNQPTGLVTESEPQDSSSLDDRCPFNHLPIESIMDGSRGICMTYFKKKRSNVVFQEIMEQEDSIDLLTNLLQSKNLVSVPIIYDDLPSPCKSSCSDDNVCALESDSNICYNANSPLALTSSKLKDCDLSTMPELLGYDSSDNLFDVLLISEEELFDGFPSPVTRTSGKPQNGAYKVPSCQNNPTIEAEEREIDLLRWQLKGKRKPRHQRRNPEDYLNRYEILEPSIQPKVSPDSLVYYDVHIEVEASHSSQNVPNISLMSILNRKPISGHPISVEVLEDDGCDFLLNTLELYALDEDYGPTGTRTRSMKTRMLSSLTDKPPTSACIPIKMVFSRIHEALDGSISKG